MRLIGTWIVIRGTQELREMEKNIDKANVELWNSKGLNVLSPRDVALQYVSVSFGGPRSRKVIPRYTD